MGVDGVQDGQNSNSGGHRCRCKVFIQISYLGKLPFGKFDNLRGLDVDDVKFVINYDYPNNSEDYIHRYRKKQTNKWILNRPQQMYLQWVL